MIGQVLYRLTLAALVWSTGSPGIAATVATAATDEARGTFTVKGKTTTLTHVYATHESDREDSSRQYLVFLVTDTPVAEGDRSPARLAAAAREGRLRGLRFIWVVGTDSLWTVPYHVGVEDSGRRIAKHGILDLKRYADGELEAAVKSKMLGQDWHYNATVKADIKAGGVADLEPEPAAEVEATPAPPGGGGGDPRALKVSLGKLGYQYTDEAFVHAVSDGRLDAVNLFLKIGQSPNVKDNGNHVMNLAAQWCARPPAENRTAIMQALIDAKGDVKAKDMNDSTPLLWAVQSCEPAMIAALIKAGSDVNAKAKGGATPLMMATVLSKPEIVALLKKAGAK